MPRKIVHVTEVPSFRGCRRKWKYEYRDNLKPKIDGFPFVLGSAVHLALENRYRAIQQGDKLPLHEQMAIVSQSFDDNLEDKEVTFEQRIEINELRELAMQMIRRYDQWCEVYGDWTQAQIWDVEHKFEIRIPGTMVWLSGKMDLVIRNEANRLAPVDHKTFKNLATDQHLYLDDQMTAYQWILWQETGKAPGSAIYNQLLKAIPKKPELLKDGTRLSKANITSTWQVYREAIAEHGFDETDYYDMEKKLEGNIFFTRTEAARTVTELKNFTKYLRAAARELFSPSTVLYPSPEWDCTWACPFMSLCKCENEGGDTKALAAALYRVEE